jgi:hypothetical protein
VFVPSPGQDGLLPGLLADENSGMLDNLPTLWRAGCLESTLDQKLIVQSWSRSARYRRCTCVGRVTAGDYDIPNNHTVECRGASPSIEVDVTLIGLAIDRVARVKSHKEFKSDRSRSGDI